VEAVVKTYSWISRTTTLLIKTTRGESKALSNSNSRALCMKEVSLLLV
jgi:hypothetical protein